MKIKALVLAGYLFLFAPFVWGAEEGKDEYHKWIVIAAGFGIAIAAFGGAISQSRAASSALEGIARNPSASDKIFVPMILGLALIESLVIYALIVALMLYGKLP
jgi:F-type H+-transporting ATPase subunit c